MTYNAIDIASAIIREYDKKGKGISNLKLQKVMYYVQTYSLLNNNEPIMFEHFEAWRHGPVVREIYDDFKIYVSENIPLDDVDLTDVDICNDGMKAINTIVEKTLDLDAWELVTKTHETKPWLDNYVPDCNFIIPNSDIKKYGEINI